MTKYEKYFWKLVLILCFIANCQLIFSQNKTVTQLTTLWGNRAVPSKTDVNKTFKCFLPEIVTTIVTATDTVYFKKTTDGTLRAITYGNFLAGGGGTNWLTTGNAGTIYPTNFLGTTDNQNLSIQTSSSERIFISKNGNITMSNIPIGIKVSIGDAVTDTSLYVVGKAGFGTPTPTTLVQIGANSVVKGTLGMAGNTSGLVTIQPQASAGTYNFNLPTSAGTSGFPLLSGGGGSTAQTYTTLALGTATQGKLPITQGGTGTNLASIAVGDLIVGDASNSVQLIPDVAVGKVLSSGGVGAVPTWSTPESWNLNGTTVTSEKFIGTIDNFDFPIRTNNTEKFRITSDGRIFGTSLHNNSGSITGTTNQYIASGTYTFTATLVSNVDAVTTYTAQFMRVGNVVTVSGMLDIDLTALASTSEFRLPFPIASAITNATQGGGACNSATNGQTFNFQVSADAPNDAIRFKAFGITSTSNLNYHYCYTYLIQ
jgi:hypothetical protein